MKKEDNKSHKWDLILDECIRCGLKRRNKQNYTKDGYKKMGWITEYFVNGKWISIRPNCKKL